MPVPRMALLTLPLVVDRKPGIDSERAAARGEITLARTGREAQFLLGTQPHRYHGIFVNPASLGSLMSVAILRLAHMIQAGTPLFILDEGTGIPFTQDELKKMAVANVVKKPFKPEDLSAQAMPFQIHFDPAQALQAANNATNVTLVDSDFTPILAQHFLSGRTSFFDLFIRINATKYMKLVQAGDAFEPEKLNHYLAKGLTHLHIRKTAQASYLDYCDELAWRISERDGIPIPYRFGKIANLGRETFNYLQLAGVNDASLHRASRFVDQLWKLLQKPDFKATLVRTGLIHEIKKLQHSVSVALVSSLIAHSLGVRSLRSLKAIGLAAIFHDIGLAEKESSLKPAQKQLSGYLSHPQRAVAHISHLHGMDPIVFTIIAQHHERRDGRGFPKKLQAGSIHRFSEIVGLADELVQRIESQATHGSVDPLAILESELGDGFSASIINAFRQAFGQAPRSMLD